MRVDYRAALVSLVILAVGCTVQVPGIPGVNVKVPRKEASVPAQGTVQTMDKVPISYEMLGKGDPTLVFIHCWACDRTFWRYQIEAFSKEYRVVAFDLPGHGRSGKERAAWSIDALGADVADLVDALKLEDVVLIGHSMGGPVALAAAKRLPGRVRGVVCADALHNAEMQMTSEMIEPIAASFETDFPGTMRWMVESMFPPGADQKVREEVLRKSSAAATGPVIGLMRDFANVDLKAWLSAANVPIRCINAEPRPPAGPATAVEGNNRYADFDAVLMPDVGHYLMLERPEQFNEDLRFILREFAGTPR